MAASGRRARAWVAMAVVGGLALGVPAGGAPAPANPPLEEVEAWIVLEGPAVDAAEALVAAPAAEPDAHNLCHGAQNMGNEVRATIRGYPDWWDPWYRTSIYPWQHFILEAPGSTARDLTLDVYDGNDNDCGNWAHCTDATTGSGVAECTVNWVYDDPLNLGRLNVVVSGAPCCTSFPVTYRLTAHSHLFAH